MFGYRGITHPPKRGQKQLYSDRIEWRWYQKYLPESLRLDSEFMPMEEWWDYKGQSIHIDRYTIENPKATIMLLHGGGGNGRILSTFARMAMRAGCNVVAPDFPGYGLTVRTKKKKPTYQLWKEIASALVDDTKSRDQLPFIVWGLSIGGILAYATAAFNKNVDGVIATTLADTRTKETMGIVARMKILGYGSYYLFKLNGPL